VMSTEAAPLSPPPPSLTPAEKKFVRPRRAKAATSLLAHSLSMVWANGGALMIAGCMIVGLLALWLYQGTSTFCPRPLVQVGTVTGTQYLGEIVRDDEYRPAESAFTSLPVDVRRPAKTSVEQHGGVSVRRLFRVGGPDLTQSHRWVSDFEIAS